MPARNLACPSARQSGFALMDALLGLLLLSTALLGAGVSLLGSVRSSHSTWVQQQAMDLTADLAETLALAAAPDAAGVAIADWQASTVRVLPQGAQSSIVPVEVQFQPSAPLHLLQVRLAWPGAARTLPELALTIAAPGWDIPQ